MYSTITVYSVPTSGHYKYVTMETVPGCWISLELLHQLYKESATNSEVQVKQMNETLSLTNYCPLV